MPIPAFDGILNVLPPHMGNPTLLTDLSPYQCTVVELCERFCTTAARKAILEGLLNFRAELFAFQIQGFQWLGGSFLEDIETQERREPRDIDVVTMVMDPGDPFALNTRLGPNLPLLYRAFVKGKYLVDHFWLSLGSKPTQLVDMSRYWYGLFSHRRDRVWKGMLRVELIDKTDDDAARAVLENKP